MITIVAAMERELAEVRRTLETIHPRGSTPSPVSLKVLGIGSERAVAAIQALLRNNPRPELVLSIGFAAALHKELKPGSLVLAQRLYALRETKPIQPSAHYLALAQETARERGLAYSTADSLTVPHLINSPEEKRELANSTASWAANMEDYWVASAVIEAGVPFLSVRAILDPADHALPSPVASLGEKTSSMQLLAATLLAITRPWMLAPMLRLRWQSKLAGQALSSFATSFLPKAMAERNYSHV